MRPKRILLVEDDINLCQSIKLILQRSGYLVTAVDNIPEALKKLQSGHFLLVIADINLPDIYTNLIPQIMETRIELSIMLLTDQSTLEIKEQGMLRSVLYLHKPISPERLLDFVQLAIENSSHSSSDRQLIYL
jgi:DNA-binding response OmpR family regulator